MKKIFIQSWKSVKKIRSIIFINVFITVLTLCIGLYLSSLQLPIINDLKTKLLSEIYKTLPLEQLYNLLREGKVFNAILITFGFNLGSGAFLSTTLTGIIFPLPVWVMAERGIFIGMLFESEKGNFLYYIILAGTFILEFGAYILSSSAGVNIGLSFFAPKRFGTKNVWQAFGRSWIEAGRIYLWVIILLLAGAIWEISGLYLLIK